MIDLPPSTETDLLTLVNANMIIHREYESQLANMRQEYEARIKRVNDAKFRMIQKHEDEITAINTLNRNLCWKIKLLST